MAASSKKKWIAVAIAVAAIAGAAYYAFKPKGGLPGTDGEKPPEPKPTEPGKAAQSPAAPKPSPAPKAPVKPKPIIVANNAVKAADLLASGINLAIGKTLVADANGLKIFNMNGEPTFVTKRGQVVGTIVSASKVAGSNYYKIVFTGSSGAKYVAYSSGMLIR